ncbi:MAG: hypothetical protein U0M06_07245 [Clostridia bacterium]|nr:hypothetical protein [Clostridia bacterium]
MFHISVPHGKTNVRPVFCRHCGRVLKNGEYAMLYGKKVICDFCVSEITITELLRICEFQSKEELLYSVGFKRI